MKSNRQNLLHSSQLLLGRFSFDHSEDKRFTHWEGEIHLLLCVSFAPLKRMDKRGERQSKGKRDKEQKRKWNYFIKSRKIKQNPIILNVKKTFFAKFLRLHSSQATSWQTIKNNYKSSKIICPYLVFLSHWLLFIFFFVHFSPFFIRLNASNSVKLWVFMSLWVYDFY